MAIMTGGVWASDMERWEMPAGNLPPSRLCIGGPDGELGGALVVREVWTRMPAIGAVVEGAPHIPVANDDSERRERGAGESNETGRIDLGEVLIALGRQDSELPRRIDLDGDGEVTLLDIEMAIRITREQRSKSHPRPSFKAPPGERRR